MIGVKGVDMADMNSKERYKQLIKFKEEEQDKFAHSSDKLERLWAYVRGNSNPLSPEDVMTILKENNVKLDIHYICKFFKITLKKSNKVSLLFNKNDKLILSYRCKSKIEDIFYMLGHLFKNFLNDGYYFRFPKKRKRWDDNFRIELAKRFSKEFKKLLKLEILKEGGEKLHNIINAIYDLTPLPDVGDDDILKLSLLCNYYRERFKKEIRAEGHERELLIQFRSIVDSIKYLIPLAEEELQNFYYSVYGLNEMLNFDFDDYIELAKFLTDDVDISIFGKNLYERGKKLSDGKSRETIWELGRSYYECNAEFDII